MRFYNFLLTVNLVVELSKPKRIHATEVTYDGFSFPKFGIETEKSLNPDELLNTLSNYITNDGNKLEYRVLRALFLVANGQPLRSLQGLSSYSYVVIVRFRESSGN